MAPGTILYASYVSPFPPHSGERIRALNLIAGFSAAGFRVEAIVGNHEQADLESQNREGVRFHLIPFAWPRLRQSPSIYFRANGAFIEQVRAFHRQDALAAVLLDYGFMGGQIDALSTLGVPIILGTHNLESALTGQVPKTSLAARAAIRLRQGLEWAHERFFFGRADAVLCVSEEDRRGYGQFLAADRLHVVPNFIDVPDVYVDSPRENRIIMTGSFGNFQNVDGLRWFVRHVWDDSLSPRTTLCVAGRLSDNAVMEFAGVPGIVGLGTRADLLGEMARSRCAIVPLWQGGGTRLKCIEAMATRTPVVTTAKGCEGIIHGGTFRVANDALTFRAAIHDLLDNSAKAAQESASARAIFDSNYSLQANAARLVRALDAAKRVHAARNGGRVHPGAGVRTVAGEGS
ncbi:MAG TPA: glycosyltransferase family 4 protein [Micropepsaceae bacterium]|nr:glycosyltransferase family 4 protein [Micropepsaceae bacterium]